MQAGKQQLTLNLQKNNIVFYDGQCYFCHAAVNFIIQRDSKALFLFCPVQTELATQLLQQYKVDMATQDTLYLLQRHRLYTFSSAAIAISKELDGVWFLCAVFSIIPKRLRDYFYRAFAKRRYRWFGQSQSCILPTEAVRSRFIGF